MWGNPEPRAIYRLVAEKAMSDGSPSAVLCADDDKCMCFC